MADRGVVRRIAGRLWSAVKPQPRVRRIEQIAPEFATGPPVFRAPPLTPDLAAAIRLYCEQFDYPLTEAARALWETDQNAACRAEREALSPLLNAMPAPGKILEIGPGMGRSLVWFRREFPAAELHAWEGENGRRRYTVLGPRFADSWCGDIRMLRRVLEFNGIDDATVFDAREMQLADLPGPYDFLYSFFSVGFHWGLEHFLDDLTPLLHNRSVAVFTVPRQFRPFPELAGLHHRLIDFRTAWPRGVREKMLVLSKAPLPDRQLTSR